MDRIHTSADQRWPHASTIDRLLVIVFLIVMFAVQNAVAVSVVFFSVARRGFASVVIATCFGLGTAIGALGTVPTMLRERISTSRLRKDIGILSAEKMICAA
jgi:lipopolysaccharide assembly protein A